MEYVSILKDNVDLSKEHRYIRLPHPRTGQPQLYLPYTSDGRESILEVVKINCAHRRTWFIGDSKIDSGTILMHVPVDPLFLIIPIILSLISSTTHFQPLSDLASQASVNPTFALPEPFSKESVKGGWNEDIARLLALKSVKRVFKACCEKKIVPAAPPSPVSDGGSPSTPKGETYYRPSQAMILNHLKRKVEHFAQPEQYERFDHLVRGLSRDGLLEPGVDVELVRLARNRGSIDHMVQYIPPTMLASLNEAYDFKPLNDYLANRTAAQIAASAPITQSKSDPSLKAGAKRKAPASSRGVESLKKVNTSSMSKLTSFFKPKDGDKK